MAFFVLGMHAGYAIYFPELFPTRLRATGSSVCFNLGRVLGAVMLIVRGRLGSRLGMPWAATAISGLFWVGLVHALLRPRDPRYQAAGMTCVSSTSEAEPRGQHSLNGGLRKEFQEVWPWRPFLLII